MLRLNDLLRWKLEDNRLERVLWIGIKENVVVCINIREFIMPVLYNLESIGERIKDKEVVVEKGDISYKILKEEEIPNLYKNYRDKAWNIISDLVSKNEPLIYYSNYRRELVLKCVKETNVSESTINRYLKKYWIGGKCINALIPNYNLCGGKGKDKATKENGLKRGRPRNNRDLIGDGININEDIKKIFNTAINKYYKNSNKLTLRITYEMMIKEYFRDEENNSLILDYNRIPTLAQFKYWFYKKRDYKDEITKRYGSKTYEQRYRPVLGKSMEEVFAPGSLYQIDATVADVYVVSEFNRGWIIGRPVLYIILDTFSRMIVGFYVGLEGPSYMGAAMAISTLVKDKVELCKEYGVEIKDYEWNTCGLPKSIIADRGEMEGKNIEELVKALGVTIKITPPFRADWKGCVEQNFRLINLKTKPFLPGKVDCNFRERGDKDYRLDAKLTLKEFTAIIIKTILYHNNKHVMKEYDRNQYQIDDDIRPIPREIWNWGIENVGGMLKNVPEEIVLLNLMPVSTATVTSKGIKFKGVYYSSDIAIKEGWFIKARNSGSWKIKISYDLRKMDFIYIKDVNGIDFIKCFLLSHQSKYIGKSIYDVEYLSNKEKMDSDLIKSHSLQASIDLIEDIEKIVNDSKKKIQFINNSKNKRINGIDENRRIEKIINRKREGFEIGEKVEFTTNTDKSDLKEFNDSVWDEILRVKKNLGKGK
ncbi:Mu transposase C-terminal domain-containing protein [Clostridium paraputrificum]|uniref:Mu transposase C-terminal domain-containing protein n=1 Tax=Clostridium paraputrificum TaxID=29363 RepID=UPI00189986AB|nr:Mu transposase C-terminal domain-containing protein [Clostridium paraputrificum]MDB2123808.1 DDE-type integrase/transposase/recombinase [Clostridium paraputrificum]